MITTHKFIFSDARNLGHLNDQSINLIVTSPPYPMIEMWDNLFNSFDPNFKELIESGNGNAAFDLIHIELDKIWVELYRVLKPGGFACINIGDATRTIKERFRLYANHARIASSCVNVGFDSLPEIIWRKQTNAPNKFMGSGMLPAGAYITLEHEYILIFRKSGKRVFSSIPLKEARRESAYFWEERNAWFSDLWDFKGKKQDIFFKGIKRRSAAYPFELANRLVNMYSVQGDVVLDPFSGTGTTALAAMASQRNSINIEIDNYFDNIVFAGVEKPLSFLNVVNDGRLQRHIDFMNKRETEKGPAKYTNTFYNFPVITSAERYLRFKKVLDVSDVSKSIINVTYE